MNHRRLLESLCVGVIVLASATPSMAQQRATGELSPIEIRTALQASKVVFAAQAAERREAELAGLAALEGEFKSLQRAITDAASTRTIGPAEEATPAGSTSEPSDEATDRIAKTQHELDSIQARTRGIEARIEWLDSPRQRSVARAAIAKLNALRGEAEAALAEAEQPREQHLRDLADRISVIRIDPARREEPRRSSPTLSAEPRRAVIAKGSRLHGQSE